MVDMPTSKQPKKRLVLDLSPEQHDELSERARRLNLTVANMVRRALQLPDVDARSRTDLTNNSRQPVDSTVQ
jgi:hypothetical protein